MDWEKRIVVAESVPLIRQALREVVETISGAVLMTAIHPSEGVLAHVRAAGADIVLLDLDLDPALALSITRTLADDDPPSDVVLMSSAPTGREVHDGFTAGAAGHFHKGTSVDDAARLLDRLIRDGFAVDAVCGTALARHVRDRAGQKLVTLSPRERDALRLLARGLTASAMARDLHLAESTVKSHLMRLYRKLGVNNAAAAVAVAIQLNLLG